MTTIASLRLILNVKQLSSQHAPSEKLTPFVENSEEAILLSPHRILMLLAHANQVDSVQMWVRNHHDSVVILEERESSAEYAIIDVVTNASNSLRQLILFDFSSQKLADIVNEEARR